MASTNQSRTVAHRVVDEMWNQGNLDVIDEIFARDYVNHVVGSPKPLRGPAEFKQFVAMQRSAFPDMRETIDDLMTDGDRVIMRWTVTGTHSGVCMGVGPTGRRVAFTGVTIFRLGASGQVEEEWCNWDMAALLLQLGFTLQPPGSAAARAMENMT